jgi:hypothetical protein
MRLLCCALTSSVVFLLALAGSAQAADFCVVDLRESCSFAFSNIGDALHQAELASGPDRVLIGHGDFVAPSGGWSYSAADPIEIRGFGPAETVLRQSSPTPSADDVLHVTPTGLGRSLVTQLGFAVGETDPLCGCGINRALVLGSATDATDLAFGLAPGASQATGVQLASDTTLRESTFAMAADFGSTAVSVEDSTGDVEVEDLSADAFVGVQATGGVAVHVHRAHITARYDGVLAASGSSAFVDNAVVDLKPRGGENYAFVVNAGVGPDTELDVRNSTATGGDSHSRGLAVYSDSSATATGRIVNSIVDTHGSALFRHAGGTGTANLTADHNHLRAGATVDEVGAGTLTNTHASSADPRFLGDPALGEVRLRFDSPYIDAGDPAGVLGLDPDFEGDPRVVDGDGDGVAKPDLGALEYQRRAPVGLSVQATPASGPVGSPFAFSAAATDPDGDPLGYSWSWDDGASASGASVSHVFGAIGSHAGTATVTDPTGLSVSGSATVQVEPSAASPLPPSPPPVTRNPTLPRLSILRRGLRLSRTGRIPIRVICSALVREPCAGTLTIATRKPVGPRKRILRLGHAAFRVAPGKAAILRVKVSKRNARIARRLRKLRVTAIGVTRDSAGKRETVRRPATLIAASPKRKRNG